MKVFIPSPLRSYTQERSQIEAEGGTLAELLQDLDKRHPGIRFRMIDEQDGIRAYVATSAFSSTAIRCTRCRHRCDPRTKC